MFWSYSDKILEPGIGFVYKWTNTVNGMMYIGSHLGTNPKYLSSGTLIQRAFKKYGLDVFIRTILYMGPNYREVEKEILTSINASRKGNSFYNLVDNSSGYLPGVNHSSNLNGFYGKSHSEETKAILSEKASLRLGEKNAMYGRKHSEESRQKMKDNTNHFGENNPMFGYVWSDDQRKAQSERLKGSGVTRKKTYVICPHCPKEGINYMMTRYHFDNCKKKVN